MTGVRHTAKDAKRSTSSILIRLTMDTYISGHLAMPSQCSADSAEDIKDQIRCRLHNSPLRT